MSVAAVTYDFLDPGRGIAKGGATGRVQAGLREAIISLELKPGEILDKQLIAARFGVSRFPVGEAMSRLAAEGLVEIIPQSGSRVALIKLSDARENMFLRRAIEVEAVRMLAPRRDASFLEQLECNLGYQRAAIASGDRDGFHRFDLQFHATLLDALGFERVRHAADTARMGLERVRRMLSSRRRHEDTLAEHERIFVGLTRADPAEAASTMERHLASVMVELEAFATRRPELFADLRQGEARK
ncbi:MAG: GntR family transcriptional regulator [Alphaproteobacteria bacterium]|nr:GntR family transcriptional regulator [Alphaproteobacteria bacterium]